MSYIFKGTLCGRLCDDCKEDLSNVQVKLYRTRKEQQVTVLATAKPKNTLAILTEREVKAKKKSLLAQTETDEKGHFQFELGKKEDYNGEAFEIDVVVEKAPGQKERPKGVDPVQFSITVLQPRWRQTGNGQTSAWKHCIANRFWCRVREKLDAWVICGRVVTCKGKRPLPGATVSAFDADWIQDDPLGEKASTDINGRFKIYYSTSDFKQTPISWIDVELVGGPDVYFKVRLGGDLIINEHQLDGRKAGRENRGPCFCVGELCTSKVGNGGVAPEIPHWEEVEVFDVDTDFTSEGYTRSGKLVMSDGISLKGNMPLTNRVTGNALKYRFLIGAWKWPGDGTEDPAVMPSVEPTDAELRPITENVSFTAGYIYYADAHGTYSSARVTIASADLDSDGCLKLLGKTVNVDMHDSSTRDISITKNNFVPYNPLLTFNSEYLTDPPHGRAEDLGRNAAGNPLEEEEQEPIRKYKLRFQVFDADQPVNKTRNNKTLSALVIDNSPVKWALNLKELESDLCNPVSDAAHILYTLDHPHLKDYQISIHYNEGVVHDAPPLPAGSFGGDLFFRGGSSGSGGAYVDVSGDPSCAYTVILDWTTRHYHSSRNYHTSSQILYCK